MICVFFIFCSLIVPGGVPNESDAVSRFGTYGNVYLAHNYLDGQYFSEIEVGDMVRYHDGTEWEDFVVTEIIEAQAESPYSPTTRLLIEGEWWTPERVHFQIYNRPDTVVLQTCIRRDDLWAWGRLFVIAERVP